MKNSIILFLLILLFFSIPSYSQKKDTIFFDYQDKLLLKRWQDPISKEFSYGIKGNGSNGLVYLLEQKVYNNIKPRKTECLKKVIKKSGANFKKNQFDDWELNKFLDKYTLFLVKKEKMIQVESRYEIE
ncbi:hypothetical protein V3A08_13360 [Tenacibaculum maritimum]|uniref:hypothetical protein n=3 Tax=Tenacibaculum maritimum TaxID=107401 RepID=UPI0012E58371|nr:hypothetical protein [Tenacibaculum maritimum]CAA0177704.1 conserved hypothetical protein [Tenacibaculum maritimum]CAA0232857.1 conserved hypothetical protein [Tenacibaculum maritimum]